jgi:uncharacterized protein (DUF1330 family)
MTVYVIGQITIHDRAAYDRYLAGFMPVLMQHGGRLLVADEQPEVVQGNWSGTKVIVLSFGDREAYERWANSEEYRRISVDREAGTEGVILLVRGVRAG